MTSKNSFNSRATLDVDGAPYAIYRLSAIEAQSGNKASRLPFSLKILLENLLRNEDDAFVKADDILALARWDVKSTAEKEIAFRTSRVLLQDFTGVPAVVDLAAMRDAIAALGGDAQRINPLQPVDLVIDHSVQVDEYGTQAAFLINTELEFDRNKERYVFLRWGQDAFRNFRVVPPGTGICHQVNLEYLGKTVFVSEEDGERVAYPDSLVGTDSHTTMINGLGVLGWGVGGIEAEAAMLGQPVSMLIPEVIGFKLHGKLPPGATATDLVLTVTELEVALVRRDRALRTEDAGRRMATLVRPVLDRRVVLAALVTEDRGQRATPAPARVLERHAILGPGRAGDRRLDRAEIERQRVREPQLRGRLVPEEVLLRVALDELDVIVRPAGEAEVRERLVVDGEEPHRRAILRRHVRDCRAIRDGQTRRAVTMKLDKLPDHFRFAHHLSDTQHQVSRRHAFTQTAAEMNANHIRRQEVNRLAEHRSLGFNTADAPSDNAESVNHRRV